YDGDGDPDLYLTAVGPNKLLRNDNGRFLEVTQTAGVAGADDQWSSSAGFFDYDRDGDLDLFVCNYIRWSREIDQEINFTLNGRDRAYGPPTNYVGAQPYLFRNEGDGTFQEVAEEAGLHVQNRATGVPVGKSLAVIFEDIDEDGDLDVLVANDTVQNFLYRNEGDGSFEEIGELSGFAYDTGGNATGAMGIDAAFYRNDRTLGIGIGNFANEMTSLYVAGDGSGHFSDEAIIEGIGSPSRLRLSFGLLFFDYDLDGRLDLLQANGHLEEEISQIQASQQYRQPAQLFWNAGPSARACFVEVPEEEGTKDLYQAIVGRGVTCADIDLDGDVDVLLTQTGGRPKLLRNEQSLGHHWLRCKLIGAAPARDAIGAEVTLVAGGKTQKRRVMPTKSYLCQVELPITFGLGGATKIDSLTVRWPDGTQQPVTVEAVDRELIIQQKD
ncbi:MAG: CRTAC1 family protein, partial [Planctomycetota bacterium]